MNETREWIVAGAALAAAVGTIAAVVIALYRETWREWRRRPKLSLELESDWDERNLDLYWEQGASPVHWARPRVKNGGGRRSADDVEVLVTRFHALGGDEEEWQPPLDTRPLAWSNVTTPEGKAVTRVQIPPGVSRHVDLLAFPAPMVSAGGGDYRAADPKDEVRTTGLLCVVPDPDDLSNRIFENHRYRIELAVAARDVDSQTYRIEVEFDGAYRFAMDFWQRMTLVGPIRT